MNNVIGETLYHIKINVISELRIPKDDQYFSIGSLYFL